MSKKKIEQSLHNGTVDACCNLGAIFAGQKNNLAPSAVQWRFPLFGTRIFSLSLSLIFFHSIHRWPLALCFFWSSLEKCPERRRRRAEEKHFHSVIQRHLVNASILSLTTGVNCRSYSPTHSTFLLEGEAETLRLKWDKECGKKMLQLPAPHTVATSYFFPFPAANSGGRGRRPSLAQGGWRDGANITRNGAETFQKTHRRRGRASPQVALGHNVDEKGNWHKILSRCVCFGKR